MGWRDRGTRASARRSSGRGRDRRSPCSPSLRHRAGRRDAADTFRFHGSGNGHGLGMSQWGAYGLAKMGWSDRRILEHFYRGAEVRAPDLPAQGPGRAHRRASAIVHLTAAGGRVEVRLARRRARRRRSAAATTWTVEPREPRVRGPRRDRCAGRRTPLGEPFAVPRARLRTATVRASRSPRPGTSGPAPTGGARSSCSCTPCAGGCRAPRDRAARARGLPPRARRGPVVVAGGRAPRAGHRRAQLRRRR